MFLLRRFPCLYQYFRTKQCWYKGPAGTPYFYPKCRSPEAAHTSSIPRRSLQRDVQNIGTAMNPHWSQGLPRRPRRWRDRPDRTLGAEERRVRTPGMRRSAGCMAAPDPAARRPGDPVRRPARGERRTRARTPSRSAKAHGAANEVRTAAGCGPKFSAAARTQAPEHPRLARGL